MALSFDQRDGWIWMNGKMMEWSSATTHVLNHGLHYGGAVFEGIRAYNAKPFKLREHNQRLVDSANIVGMSIPYSVDELNDACMDVMAKNGLSNCYFRPVAWRGSEEMAIGAITNSIHVAIAVWDWPSYFNADEGISLVTSKWKKPAPDTSPTNSKCAAGYAIGTISKNEAVHAGYTDALMMDYRGLIAESTGSNLFMVKDNHIKTPIADCFLNGITRQTIIQLAKNNGLSIEETRIEYDELMTANEIFVTGTAAEITPVTKIDDTVFKVGETTKKLITLYKQETGQL